MVRYRHRVLHETACRVLVLKAGGALTGFKVNYQVEGGFARDGCSTCERCKPALLREQGKQHSQRRT